MKGVVCNMNNRGTNNRELVNDYFTNNENGKRVIDIFKGIPESTSEERVAKGCLYHNIISSRVDDTAALGAIYMALNQFHELADEDGGKAWQNDEMNKQKTESGWGDPTKCGVRSFSYDDSVIELSNEDVKVIEQARKDICEIYDIEPDSPFTPGDDVPDPTPDDTVESDIDVNHDKSDEAAEKDDGEESIDKDDKEETSEEVSESEEDDDRKRAEDLLKDDEKMLPAVVESPCMNHIETDKYVDGWDERIAGTTIHRDDGLVDYDGTLGKFTFNPNEFELRSVAVPADGYGNPPTSYPILKYIGDEVDGDEIKIPEGIKDISCMFSGNRDLQSLPKIPHGVENAFSAFRDCSALEATSPFAMPTTLKSAPFMFANCESMTAGPAVIPPSVKDGSGMFLNCRNMVNTPKVLPGIECMDSMFANCESLTKKPYVPHSVKYAEYATEGCKGIDEAEEAAAKVASEKAQQKFEKSLNKKTFKQHVGSVFSATMQVYAVSKSGCNIMHAMMLTHMMRKSGAFQRNMAGGWKAMQQFSNRNSFSHFAYANARQSAEKRAAKAEQKKYAKMEAFKAASTGKKDASKTDVKMYESGRDAAKSHYFEKVARDGYPAKALQRGATQMDANMLRNMEVVAAEGRMTAQTKKMFAKQAVEYVSNQASYYAGAMDGIQNMTKSGELSKDDAKAASKGMLEMSNENTEELLTTIAEMQEKHHFMNERQMQTIYASLEHVDCLKQSTMYSEFKTRMDATITESKNRENTHQFADMNSHRRTDYQTRHNERAAAAESMFGDIGNQSDDASYERE